LKKLVALLVLLVFAVMVVGCNGGGQGTDISVDDLYEAIKDQIIEDLRDLGFGDEDFAVEEIPGYTYYDLKGDDADYVLTEMDKDLVEEGFVIKATMMLNSDQIVVIKAASGKIDEVKAALETEQDNQLAMWEDYLADQAEKVRNTIIAVQGDYIIYVTYPDADAIEAIFTDME